LLAPPAGARPLLAACGARSPLDVREVPVFYAERQVVGAVLHFDPTAADIATCDP
jgi:hypothetical protein